MLTPRQQALWDRLRSDPRTAGLMTSLRLEPITSDAAKASMAISARIDVLIESFEKARNLPRAERSVIRPGIWAPGQPPMALWGPERALQISSYLEAIYGPKPWKFPLASAPF